MVLVSPDLRTTVDLAKVSDGRFGPEARPVFDAWADVVAWAASAELDFDRDGEAVRLEDLEAPSPDPRQVFAIGLNYADHAEEAGLARPDEPTVFTKFIGSFAGPVGQVELFGETVDWEAELVVVIGRTARHVPASEAWDHVAGLTVGQDFSERTVQFSGPVPQFSMGKSFVGYSPQGPWLVTPDELEHPARLAISCTINGETVQSSSTEHLMFGVPELVEYLSSILTLHPGDVIFTGTPAGVGVARDPRRFLVEGDVVETTIEGLGTLRHECVAATAPSANL